MDVFFYDKLFLLEKKHWWYQARDNILMKLLEHYGIFNSSKKILYCGLGCGSLFGKILKKNNNIIGLDNEWQSLKLTQKNNDGFKKVFLGNASSINFKYKFDFILAFDLIEHIKNDNDFITNSYNNLADNGLLILTMPAFNFLFGTPDIIGKHYRRYTKTDLKKLLVNKFEIEFISYMNFLLFPIVLITRLFNKLFNNKLIDDFNIKKESKILFFLFEIEKKFFPKLSLPWGTSVLCVVKKKI